MPEPTVSPAPTISGPCYVAIVGRPNVGKSTLFNRLIGRRKSITDAASGTTRDRVYAPMSFNSKEAFVVDTGGVQYADCTTLDALVDREVNKAIVEATVVVFVSDIQGLTALDLRLADDLRRRGKQVIAVVNKIDAARARVIPKEFYRLGFGEPIGVSAMHGENIEDVIERVAPLLPAGCRIPVVSCDFKLAIVGEPNAGKSTLLNQFIKKERAVVSDVPGTTRDVIEEYLSYRSVTIQLVDTAGIKKKKKMTTPAALFSLFRTQEVIKRSDVVLLMIDAHRGPQQDTRAIYKMIADEGKGCIVVINKWDTVQDLAPKAYAERLFQECGFLETTPLCFVSAKTGKNVTRVLDAAVAAWKSFTVSVTTHELNLFLEQIKRYAAPPPTVKFKYMVQTGIKPPSFLLFMKHKERLKANYHQFLIAQFVRRFSLEGVVPRIRFKEEKKTP